MHARQRLLGNGGWHGRGILYIGFAILFSTICGCRFSAFALGGEGKGLLLWYSLGRGLGLGLGKLKRTT